jgi:tRNA-dihydrouridine synthase B
MQKYWYKSDPAELETSRTADDAVPERSVPAPRPFPSALQIGPVTIRPATVLAPMAGVTDTVFRRFIKNLGGCGLIMTEFTSADGVLRSKKTVGRYLHFYEDEHPISAQLFGSSPQVLADAARLVEDLGFDLVDLNLGCPAKKVVKCNGGSGLLRDLPLIRQIFESVRAAVKIPFTVKFRAGWSDDEIVCVELARIAEGCGLGAVALHARTREQGYSGNARWEWIASVKQAVKIPVIGNGDIRSPEDAAAMVSQTGCDAVMIGRMAPANPWIFRQIEQYVSGYVETGHGEIRNVETGNAEIGNVGKGHVGTGNVGTGDSPVQVERSSAAPSPASAAGGQLYTHPTEADRYQMIRTYFAMLLEEEMPDAVGKMKQFASWFTHGIPGGAGLRKSIYDSNNGPEILKNVEEFFEAKLQSIV